MIPVGLLFIYLCIALIGMFCTLGPIIAMPWIIIKKSGEKGAKILIPFYGTYVYMKAVDSETEFFAAYFVNLIFLIFITLCSKCPPIALILQIIQIVINIYLYVSYCRNISSCFDKKIGFTIGLIFLHPIFLAILAFGKSKNYNILVRDDSDD